MRRVFKQLREYEVSRRNERLLIYYSIELYRKLREEYERSNYKGKEKRGNREA